MAVILIMASFCSIFLQEIGFLFPGLYKDRNWLATGWMGRMDQTDWKVQGWYGVTNGSGRQISSVAIGY